MALDVKRCIAECLDVKILDQWKNEIEIRQKALFNQRRLLMKEQNYKDWLADQACEQQTQLQKELKVLDSLLEDRTSKRRDRPLLLETHFTGMQMKITCGPDWYDKPNDHSYSSLTFEGKQSFSALAVCEKIKNKHSLNALNAKDIQCFIYWELSDVQDELDNGKDSIAEYWDYVLKSMLFNPLPDVQCQSHIA